MKKRHVFSTPDVATAEAVRREARRLGIGRECVFLEASQEIERRIIDDERKNVSMDIVPAAYAYLSRPVRQVSAEETALLGSEAVT